MMKISAVYLIGNPEICQDPPAVGKMIRPFWLFEAKEAVEVIEASDVIMSVEVIGATEVFKTT